MIDFSEILNRIKDFYREKKLVAIVSTVLISLFVLALIAFIFQTIFTPSKIKSIQKEETILIPDQKILLPNSPSSSNEYALTREPQEQWDSEDAKKYFTLPTDKELNELEKANDKLINDILGENPWKKLFIFLY